MTTGFVPGFEPITRVTIAKRLYEEGKITMEELIILLNDNPNSSYYIYNTDNSDYTHNPE
jgi:hypothetical protein